MEKLFIHHSAVSRNDVSSQLLPINKYHQQKWNMKSKLGFFVGYNFLIDCNGIAHNTRQIGEETIAQVGYNFNSISICLAGDFGKELPTDSQILSLRQLIKDIRASYKDIQIVFHRDFADTLCPGSLFTKEYLNTVILQTQYSISDADVEKNQKIKELSSKISMLQKILFELSNLVHLKKNR